MGGGGGGMVVRNVTVFGKLNELQLVVKSTITVMLEFVVWYHLKLIFWNTCVSLGSYRINENARIF